MIEHIFFDLDGTLTDPAEGLTNSIAFALARHGIVIEDKMSLQRHIGPPLFDTFENEYGFSHEEAAQCVDDFREYFRPKGIFENKVFPGIPEMLQRLIALGKQLYVATSKPELFANQILDHFDLSQYFEVVAGGTMDESLIQKPDILRCALKRAKITKTDTCVMIGDRRHDILGGHEVGMRAIGILYGYGSREELSAAGADAIADNLDELIEIIQTF